MKGGDPPIEHCCLHQAVHQQAVRSPDRVALVCGDRKVSYRDLSEEASRFARGMEAVGIGAGDLIGCGFPQSIELVVCFLACGQIGAVAIPLDLEPHSRSWGVLLQSAPVGRVISNSPEMRERIRQFAPQSVVHDFHELMKAGGGASGERPAECAMARPWFWNLTSGSTGFPRAVAASHEQIWWNTRSSVDALELGADDVHLCGFPGYVHPHEIFARALWTGACAVLVDLRTGYRSILEQIAATGVTRIHASPLFYHQLAAASRGRMQFKQVRSAESGGMATTARVASEVLEVLGVGLRPVWGSTETSGVAFRSSPVAAGVHRDPREIGGPQPFYAATLEAGSGANAQVELVVSGPAVAAGYVFGGDPSGRLAGGRFRTGDLAECVRGGAYVLRGRADDIVKIGGGQVSLGEVEAVLREHPLVRDVLVVATPDELRGHVLTAYVEELAESFDATSLRDFCATRLTPFEVPRHFRRIEALPRTAAGKPSRSALMEMLS